MTALCEQDPGRLQPAQHGGQPPLGDPQGLADAGLAEREGRHGIWWELALAIHVEDHPSGKPDPFRVAGRGSRRRSW